MYVLEIIKLRKFSKSKIMEKDIRLNSEFIIFILTLG